MRTWSKQPVIYEINTWVWLSELDVKGINDCHAAA